MNQTDNSPQTIADEIMRIIKKYGNEPYGERCTQLSHSVQAGLIARNQGLDDALILAALLHDIGHLVPQEFSSDELQHMGKFGIQAHDKWGERYLRSRKFAERVVAPVANHVAAKRYLCATDGGYFDRLSPASVETLNYQGGPMNSEEANDFKTKPFFTESITIRHIDEQAKAPDFVVTDAHLDYFSDLIHQHCGT